MSLNNMSPVDEGILYSKRGWFENGFGVNETFGLRHTRYLTFLASGDYAKDFDRLERGLQLGHHREMICKARPCRCEMCEWDQNVDDVEEECLALQEEVTNMMVEGVDESPAPVINQFFHNIPNNVSELQTKLEGQFVVYISRSTLDPKWMLAAARVTWLIVLLNALDTSFRNLVFSLTSGSGRDSADTWMWGLYRLKKYNLLYRVCCVQNWFRFGYYTALSFCNNNSPTRKQRKRAVKRMKKWNHFVEGAVAYLHGSGMFDERRCLASIEVN